MVFPTSTVKKELSVLDPLDIWVPKKQKRNMLKKEQKMKNQVKTNRDLVKELCKIIKVDPKKSHFQFALIINKRATIVN